MDCSHARLLLEIAHPLATELEAADAEALRAHLRDCPECGPLAAAERRVDDHLGRAVRAVPVPPALKQRLLTRLNVERDAWYRQWFIRAAGVAAGLLLAVGLAWGLWLGKKPVPDWGDVSVRVNNPAYTEEQVKEGYAAAGVRTEAPPQFEYRYLEWFGQSDFQGRQVPHLLFHFPGGAFWGGNQPQSAVAHVYVLSDRQFDLDEGLKQTVPQGSGHTIKVEKHPGNPHYLYVIIYTGPRLEVFRTDNRPQG